MKRLFQIFLFASIVFTSVSALAQDSKLDEKAAIVKQIKNKIDSTNYTFKAIYVNPTGQVQQFVQLTNRIQYLTQDYTVRVTKDTVDVWLPYFGRVYMKAPIGTTDGGLKFTSTKFDYKTTKKKKGWQIVINFKDTDLARRMTLDVFENGTAMLNSISNYRDPISFNGQIITK